MSLIRHVARSNETAPTNLNTYIQAYTYIYVYVCLCANISRQKSKAQIIRIHLLLLLLLNAFLCSSCCIVVGSVDVSVIAFGCARSLAMCELIIYSTADFKGNHVAQLISQKSHQLTRRASTL